MNGQVDGEGPRHRPRRLPSGGPEPLNGRPNIQPSPGRCIVMIRRFSRWWTMSRVWCRCQGCAVARSTPRSSSMIRGPCLVEIAARLAGAGAAGDVGWSHGGRSRHVRSVGALLPDCRSLRPDPGGLGLLRFLCRQHLMGCLRQPAGGSTSYRDKQVELCRIPDLGGPNLLGCRSDRVDPQIRRRTSSV